MLHLAIVAAVYVVVHVAGLLVLIAAYARH